MQFQNKNIIVLPHQQFYKAEDLSDSLILNQKFLYNQFDNCNLTNVTFENCVLAYCSILNSFAKNLQFKDCDLTGTRVYNTSQYNLTFDNCDLSGFHAENSEDKSIFLNCFKFNSGYKLPNERINF